MTIGMQLRWGGSAWSLKLCRAALAAWPRMTGVRPTPGGVRAGTAGAHVSTQMAFDGRFGRVATLAQLPNAGSATAWRNRTAAPSMPGRDCGEAVVDLRPALPLLKPETAG